MRAIRTNPRVRKAQILAAAMSLASEVGHKNITRDAVAMRCDISSSAVAKYYSTMHKLKAAVLCEAIRSYYMPVLQHCAADPDLFINNPDLKPKILQYLSS